MYTSDQRAAKQPLTQDVKELLAGLKLPPGRPKVLEPESDLVLYFDSDGKESLRASQVPKLGYEELLLYNSKVLELIATLKSKRDSLNKKYRHREIQDTKLLRKARRWLAKAGAMCCILQQELSKRKRQHSAAFAQAFVDAAQQGLDPDVFGDLVDAAVRNLANS
jgi:hypothetical protein